jgi:glutathione synthase/RimK-type ligase-like ATP-grasp enzyme
LVVAPCILQEFIPKAFDVRVTIVGDSIFAAAIHSQDSGSTQVDWRAGVALDLKHEVVEAPSNVAEACFALCRDLGLEFAAIDFAVRDDGSWVFFEVNPNGQWAWLVEQPGLPIARAMAERLLSVSRPN